MSHPVVRIGLVGDRSPAVRAHGAIPVALELAGRALSVTPELTWLHTRQLDGASTDTLTALAGVWCVPGSPYENMDGALTAIRTAREQGIPFLGTCGGFQHALIEFARNVLGLRDADHAESNPDASMPLVGALSCSLVGMKGKVTLTAGSQAAKAYGRTESTEAYHCNYGLNTRYRHVLDGAPLRITGEDEEGAVRVVELTGHPFFMATLFQPELSASTGQPHPLIQAFLAAAAARMQPAKNVG
ncbi:CTP synthase [Pyxidicoccus parkwayensis]|uniref:CTP synthase (glutamine hydrolyzing) n=1 Tax=Pyxidicoccus parkwayensis TaxID=2813578 RepID=A0ABX7NUH2_9BACT|nr:CTP synthase [Pyxidicoccus parkwaysis]QSQ22071.1 CTP synthase [Pyxidicoccus parkwaysis]